MQPRRPSRNIEMLGLVAKGLERLEERVVFVGGATVDLFISDPAAPGTRETEDVDCVVEVTGRVRFHALEERLRAIGFKHPVGERAPLCRWGFCGIKVDVMPVEGAVLGFTNRWYREGMENAEEIELAEGRRILVFSLPYLLASKLEAFRDRGKGDYIASKDLEDIVALLDGCLDAEKRIGGAPAGVRASLAREFGLLCADPLFLIGLEGHLSPEVEGAERMDRCVELMRRVAAAG